MSTAYNRRRGAKANHSRTPRQCRYIVAGVNADGLPFDSGCIRLADGASQFCTDHRLRAPAQPEGPISRRLRLEHQARQSAEDARVHHVTHHKQPAWWKVHRRRLAKKIATTAKKSLGSLLNPWAR